MKTEWWQKHTKYWGKINTTVTIAQHTHKRLQKLQRYLLGNTRRTHHVLPGFSLSLGITLSWIGFFIMFPIIFLFVKASEISITELWFFLTRPAAIKSFQITITYAFACGIINVFVGLIIAWTLIRFPFKTSTLFDAIIDLPFAIPGAVGGIALANILGKNGIIGKFFDNFGIQLIYNQFGIIFGLLFVTLPFAVRSIQPLIQDLEIQEEHAATMLGANKWKIFTKVQLPYLIPGMFSAFILSFSRSIGEYGVVIFLAGNIPLKSEVISRYIYNKVDQYNLPGAVAVASVLLLISLLMLCVFNFAQYRWRKKFEQ